MANTEYKFTNEDTEVRGRVVEVIEFAKQRGIFLHQIEVFRDPDALKDLDSKCVVSDLLDKESNYKNEAKCDSTCHKCGNGWCYNHPEYGVEDVPPETEDIFGMFRKIFGFDE